MFQKVDGVMRLIDRLNERVAYMDRYLLFVMMMLVPFEVVMRYVFNRPTSWAMEATQYLFLAMIVLGGGWALRIGAHVNVDILYNLLGKRAQGLVGALTTAVLIFFLSLVFWNSLTVAMTSFAWLETSGSGWNPPIYPVKFLIPIGTLLFLLQGVALLLGYIHQALTGVERAARAQLSLEESVHQ